MPAPDVTIPQIEAEVETNKQLDVNWIEDDVLGPEGHEDNDVGGKLHDETLFPSESYEINPFSFYDRYRKTHVSPEEGYHAIFLQRDPLSTRPWGFVCNRQEFGGLSRGLC